MSTTADRHSTQVPASAPPLPLTPSVAARDCLPRGVLGLSADLCHQYVEHIADRRLERIGLPTQYDASNPFPWMSETMDLGKEKNFFETRVTEYQAAATLKWE